MKIKRDTVKFTLNRKESKALTDIMEVLWCNISSGDLDTMGIEEAVETIANAFNDIDVLLDESNESRVLYVIKEK